MSPRQLEHLGRVPLPAELLTLLTSLLKQFKLSTTLSNYVLLHSYGHSRIYGELGSAFVCIGSPVRSRQVISGYEDASFVCCAVLLPQDTKKLEHYFTMYTWYNGQFSDWRHPSFASFLLYQASFLINRPLQRYVEDLKASPLNLIS